MCVIVVPCKCVCVSAMMALGYEYLWVGDDRQDECAKSGYLYVVTTNVLVSWEVVGVFECVRVGLHDYVGGHGR